MTTVTYPGAKILYIEDDEDDRFLMRLSLNQNHPEAELICAETEKDAMSYLRSVSISDLPSLIVVDLNLPGWGGRQTISDLKRHPHLSSIPVVVFTTSSNPAEKEICKLLGARNYYVKPFHFDDYGAIVEAMFHDISKCG